MYLSIKCSFAINEKYENVGTGPTSKSLVDHVIQQWSKLEIPSAVLH